MYYVDISVWTLCKVFDEQFKHLNIQSDMARFLTAHIATLRINGAVQFVYEFMKKKILTTVFILQ